MIARMRRLPLTSGGAGPGSPGGESVGSRRWYAVARMPTDLAGAPRFDGRVNSEAPPGRLSRMINFAPKTRLWFIPIRRGDFRQAPRGRLRQFWPGRSHYMGPHGPANRSGLSPCRNVVFFGTATNARGLSACEATRQVAARAAASRRRACGCWWFAGSGSRSARGGKGGSLDRRCSSRPAPRVARIGCSMCPRGMNGRSGRVRLGGVLWSGTSNRKLEGARGREAVAGTLLGKARHRKGRQLPPVQAGRVQPMPARGCLRFARGALRMEPFTTLTNRVRGGVGGGATSTPDQIIRAALSCHRTHGFRPGRSTCSPTGPGYGPDGHPHRGAFFRVSNGAPRRQGFDGSLVAGRKFRLAAHRV